MGRTAPPRPFKCVRAQAPCHRPLRAQVVSFDPMDSEETLGTALAPPDPILQSVSGVSLTRWDEDGRIVSDATVTFEIWVQPKHRQMVFYRFPSASSEGVLLTSEGGTVGQCLIPDPRCFRLTSPKTSAFVAYERVPPPKGFCDPAPNRHLSGCVDGCTKYFTLQVRPCPRRSHPRFRIRLAVGAIDGG